MRKLLLVLASTALLTAQTAKFPGAVATDQDLLHAYDRAGSTLSADIDSTTLTIPVADGATFAGAAYFSVTIDAERILICSVSGNTLTACSGGRGYSGSAATSHLTNAAVRATITAWHHNALAAEVKAIETALGAGLANVVQTSGSYSDPSWLTISKSKVGLGNVENTALSTWAGSSNITTVGALTGPLVIGSANNSLTFSDNGTVGSITAPVHPMVFSVNGSERARIDASGHLGVNNTNPQALLDIVGSGWFRADPQVLLGSSAQAGLRVRYDGANNVGSIFAYDYGTSASKNLQLQGPGGNVGIGNVITPSYLLQLASDSAAKPTTNTWTITSDVRVKTNIRPFTDGLALVQQLAPKSYELNGLAGLPAGATGISVIAQDVAPIAPYLVGTYKAKLHPDDTTETDLYNLNTGPLTWVLVNAVNDLVKQTIQPVFAEDIEPVCDEAHRGQSRFVKDDLLGDKLRVCGRSADGTYRWLTTVQF
jgi:hypothetical protein